MNLFQNTETAFQYKTNRELKKALFLFRAMSKPWIVRPGSIFAIAALKIGLPLGWVVKPTIFSHFCGGEDIDQSLKVTKKLSGFNVKTILDYSVEAKKDEKEISAVLSETLKTIEVASGNPDIPFAVFKPTAFAPVTLLTKASAGDTLLPSEEEGLKKFRKRIYTLCETASRLDVPILIDAEESFYQDIIDRVAGEMMEQFNKKKAIVFNTLQMYRHDRTQFLSNCFEKAVKGGYFAGIKLVRGAYLEKERLRAGKMGYPSPVHPDKESTDRAYDNALSFCIENMDRIYLFNGTHNEKSCLHMNEEMKKHNIANNDQRAYHSQLYGMSDHISFNLAAGGYNVAKYLPYGPVNQVLPYLIRRAEENRAVAGQTGRELMLIKTEMKRRKQLKNKT